MSKNVVMSKYNVKFNNGTFKCDSQGWVTGVNDALTLVANFDLLEFNKDNPHQWRFKDWENRLIVSSNKPEGHPIKNRKQPRYQDNKGEDWIDECARTLTPEEFRGAMMFTMGKYIRRMGKKDDVKQEVGKLADYANRWLQYESQLDDS